MQFLSKLLLPATLLFTVISCREASDITEPADKGSLDQLMEGNQRFASHHARHPHASANRMKEIATGQHPTVAVICCSDSRVPPEIIFDQGLGDMFVVRTAGNLLGGLEIGSLEYAVEHLGVKQLLVMGHRECGAVKAFIQGGDLPGHIRDIVDSLRAEQEIMQLSPNDHALLEHCIRANILHGIHQLKKESALIREKIEKGELSITAACYDIKKGTVEVIEE